MGPSLEGLRGGGVEGVLGLVGSSMLLASGWQNSSKVFFLFKSRCPSILSVKGVYADVEEFVAIRDWVSIVSTSVQPRLRRSRSGTVTWTCAVAVEGGVRNWGRRRNGSRLTESQRNVEPP